ncbi:ribulose-phosphate 3-epimerase [Staphylococcus argenteus]|uniref:ribulose-phosphate 3-epimerase n=1 Tax=Staphylococcus argenteus TaxID=985002 RepID=UPI001EDAE525|nr:ribulose-phosphate 3-epimerase [Staphylococcus argenteus]
MTKLFPSLLSVDFLNLQHELNKLEEAGVDGVHFDVMDGQFVPNISIGLPILDAVRKGTSLPIDVHLMIENPENYIASFVEHGADMISIHVESTSHIHRAIQMIKHLNKKAGLVINPGTPVAIIEPILDIVDYVLVMTVNPGFGGQSFITQCVEKIAHLNAIKMERQLNFEIEVDGGVNNDTAKVCIDNGATMLVTGSFFFNQNDYKKVTQQLKG